MAGQFVDFWRIVKPSAPKTSYVGDPDDFKLYSNFSWYSKVMKGAGSRFQKYSQYKNMDGDVFVSRALDQIAAEMTSEDTKTNLPFKITYQSEANEEVPENIVVTVRAALRHWCDMQNLYKLSFDIARMTVKFGDCFFRKTSDFKLWEYVDPSDVIGIHLDKETGKPQFYQVRKGDSSDKNSFGDAEIVPAAGMVHFSLSSGIGDNGPFGESVLFPVIKAFRHLSLLQDSVIIYRIVRAPERRVFSIDVGNMPPQRAKAYLEAIKNEIKQKRMPNESGGQEKIDSVYNPMSMVEDYFFMQTADGRGSKVDTLSGGENLGEIKDLNYFQNIFLQGLRIPSSYMRGSDDNGSQVQDGKVGVAYMEERNFFKYVQRLQRNLCPSYDREFKAYLKSAGIRVDSNLFKIELTDPQNFDVYKQAEVDEKLMSNFNNIKDVEFIAGRVKLSRYLGWSEDEIQMNEEILKKELGLPADDIDERLTIIRMMYDKNWIEHRPEPKVDESWDNHVAASKQQVAPEEQEPAEDEAAPEEEAEEGGEEEAPDDEAEAGADLPSVDDMKKTLG
jgi:hypothetical protein